MFTNGHVQCFISHDSQLTTNDSPQHYLSKSLAAPPVLLNPMALLLWPVHFVCCGTLLHSSLICIRTAALLIPCLFYLYLLSCCLSNDRCIYRLPPVHSEKERKEYSSLSIDS